MSVVELSKVLMNKFHYDYIKNKYDNKSTLLPTDTGSLIFEIKIEDICENFNSDKEIFDFSNYSTKSKNTMMIRESNHKKMKDETDGVEIEELVGLKPKMYSFLVDDNSEYKTAKDEIKMLFQQ